MKVFRYLRLAVLFCGLVLGLTACRVDMSPITSASVKSLSDGRVDNSWTLSEEQVAQLNKWLIDNRGGWEVTKTQYPPGVLVNAQHKDGQVSTLSISRNLVLIAFKGELHVQKFDPADILELQLILGNR